MATTTNYGWTTPDDTALVKDGAAAIRTLGSSVDTTTKALNPSTTLGDIEYRSSTANTNTRLGIGTTGQILTVAGGVPSWVTPAGGGGMTLINTGGTTLSGSSISIGSIPSTYIDLRLIVVNFRPATDSAALMIRYNSDTSTLYRNGSYNDAQNVGGTSSWASTLNQISGDSDNGASDSLINFYMPGYAQTTWKPFYAVSITNDPTTPGSQFKALYYANQYGGTSAISSIDLFPSSGNFTSGTAYLYGVK